MFAFARSARRAAAAGPQGWRRAGRSAARCAAACGTLVAGATGASVLHRGPAPMCEQTPQDRVEPWKARWAAKMTSWHLKSVNPFLERYVDELVPAREPAAPGMGPRVLVPLCGRSVDMAYLARRGYRVIGVDCVQTATDEFAEEFGVPLPTGGRTMLVQLPPPIDAQKLSAKAILIAAEEGEATRTEAAPPVLMLTGDFLEVGAAEAEALVPVDAAFDRGALVAVDPKDREQYAQSLTRLIAPGGRVLLVATEHQPFKGGKLGPPFQVTEAEVKALFGAAFEIRQLCREDTIDRPPGGMRERGIDHFYEVVYLLTKRAAKS
eukprot:TRINITY_DN32296_c0_g1_i1.p1 TRINITY_DN32296_c0_g1~~TRINITY_DN32296_c0_g1_i1.p1  ORF type:complete len:337 (+),score=69.29 TRINITY_DN32296_c0_g1_i1:47-1012(+)